MWLLRPSLLLYLFCFLAPIFPVHVLAQSPQEAPFDVEFPAYFMKGISEDLEITWRSTDSLPPVHPVTIRVNGDPFSVRFKNRKAVLPVTVKAAGTLKIQSGHFHFTQSVRPIPLWMSVLPPLVAILMALFFREVFSALFIGLLIGTVATWYYQDVGVLVALFKGLLTIVDTYLLESLNNSGHLSIILFSMLIGGMVSIITKNGGMNGIVDVLSRYAHSPRSGQFVTWLLGITIFFDDYANTLVVGNTMRPVTDRMRISREKLSYIVDSTAAPVAAIAFVTTWIGAELSYIQDGIVNIGLKESPYEVFISSLSYSFYPVFTLLFILLLIYHKRDFGPMLKAEYRARKGVKKPLETLAVRPSENEFNGLEVDETVPRRWYNAALPVLVVVFGTLLGLVSTGLESSQWDTSYSVATNISNIIGNSDSYRALLWSSLAGTIVVVILSTAQRILSLKQCMDSLINGFRTMLPAIVILMLAWSIALLTEHLHTADFISQVLIAIDVAPYLIPAITFVLAALVAFSTGSSWGTMAILYPLILPSSWLLCQQWGLGYEESMRIFHNVVSTVLAGSVLGDHCSPISDTTILSSLASSCNHIEHVRTQLPYALTVGAVSVVIGTIPAALGISSWLLFPVGILIMYGVVVLIGKPVPDRIK